MGKDIEYFMKWILALAATLLLSSCTPPTLGDGVQDAQVDEIEYNEFTTQAEQTGIRLEESLHDHRETAFVAAGELYIILFGSSSCPPVPSVHLVATEDELITEAELRTEVNQGACTDDYAPHTYALSFNEPVSEEVEVRVLSNDSSEPIPVLSANTANNQN